jgi:hypothetical protein
MQLLSHLQLQDQLGASYRRRAFLLSTPGRVPEPKQCAAFLLTRGEESIMYNHSTVPVAQEDLKAKRRTKRMTRMAASIYFATMLLPVVAIAAPKDGLCGIGTLIDVQAHVEVIQAGTIEHGRETVKKNGRKEYDSYSTSNLQKQTTYTVTIVLDDLTYTAQSELIFGFGFKPTSLVVNDPIGVCVRGSTLALERPDGKEYRARILRVARVPRADRPAGMPTNR